MNNINFEPIILSNPNIEQFTVLGISHWKAPVEIREHFSLSTEQQKHFLELLKKEGIQDALILVTCNRTEIYAVCPDVNIVKNIFQNIIKASTEWWQQYSFCFTGQKAVELFFRVAAGLDSQILGDQQIIQQVKQSYKQSYQQQITTSFFNRLIQLVTEAHKQIRTRTDFGSGSASIASAATRYLTRAIPNLNQAKILLVGAGKIGTTTCKNLFLNGAEQISVMNRHAEKAIELAQHFPVQVLEYSKLHDALPFYNIVIVATGAQAPIIKPQNINYSALSPKQYFIDLSVPRNIDPAIAEISNIELLNVDMLAKEIDETIQQRQEAIPEVEKIIQQKLEEFYQWHEDQKIVPTIKALCEKLEAIRHSEIEVHRNKFSAEDLDKIDLLTHRIISKITAQTIQFLRQHNDTSSASEFVNAMFELETAQNAKAIK